MSASAGRRASPSSVAGWALRLRRIKAHRRRPAEYCGIGDVWRDSRSTSPRARPAITSSPSTTPATVYALNHFASPYGRILAGQSTTGGRYEPIRDLVMVREIDKREHPRWSARMSIEWAAWGSNPEPTENKPRSAASSRHLSIPVFTCMDVQTKRSCSVAGSRRSASFPGGKPGR
jgi:hypothetical protein